MSFEFFTKSRVATVGALIVGAALALSAGAQSPGGAGPGGPPPGGAGGPPGGGAGGPPGGPGGGMPSPADQAIAARQAIYTLVGSNFQPLGGVLQGRTPYDQADVKKRAERVAFLASMLSDAFPDVSKDGKTKAKPEVWSNRAAFDKKLKDFQDHAAALAQVAAKEKTNSDAFKAAAGAVGQDCKGCHDDFRAR